MFKGYHFKLLSFSWYNEHIKKVIYFSGGFHMATSKAQKKRNRKILWYLVLIGFTILQGFLISDSDDA
jgi:hypothetical protein